LLALFVTFLWSTSVVLIKIGLRDIPALPFAGLRYALAFLCLLPLALARPADRAALRALSSRDWLQLAVLGLLLYTFTQGAQYLALTFLPALTLNMVLNSSPLLVALLGAVFLNERPTAAQCTGLVLFVAGAWTFFFPTGLAGVRAIGLLLAAAEMLSSATASVLGRRINGSGRIPPLAVTVATMGFGAVALLGGGVWAQGWPELRPAHWAIVAWLAVANTALAFTLYNATMRTLPVTEASVIYGTKLIQVAILAWLFLGEVLTPAKVVGMTLSGVGALLVQLRSVRVLHKTGESQRAS
jgi:drug/metabolite transporter (DMT)-like permease